MTAQQLAFLKHLIDQTCHAYAHAAKAAPGRERGKRNARRNKLRAELRRTLNDITVETLSS